LIGIGGGASQLRPSHTTARSSVIGTVNVISVPVEKLRTPALLEHDPQQPAQLDDIAGENLDSADDEPAPEVEPAPAPIEP
jgi:hypothetical protein